MGERVAEASLARHGSQIHRVLSLVLDLAVKDGRRLARKRSGGDPQGVYVGHGERMTTVFPPELLHH
jgi:hypothetical protein